mmetsp:Transcript_78479/g.224893  ORF Transcript_78479/g.224893 Transcript_78479/m.224893 type:complete len:234 (+) Transcript_78479:1466-2167(+)
MVTDAARTTKLAHGPSPRHDPERTAPDDLDVVALVVKKLASHRNIRDVLVVHLSGTSLQSLHDLRELKDCHGADDGNHNRGLCLALQVRQLRGGGLGFLGQATHRVDEDICRVEAKGASRDDEFALRDRDIFANLHPKGSRLVAREVDANEGHLTRRVALDLPSDHATDHPLVCGLVLYEPHIRERHRPVLEQEHDHRQGELPSLGVQRIDHDLDARVFLELGLPRHRDRALA